MRVAMIGAGYVGLVSAACFSEFGFAVTCVDSAPERIAALKAGRSPIYEPGLEAMLAANVAAGRLAFTGDIADAVAGADVVMLAVGTPSRRGDGHADLSFVHEAARQVANALDGYTVVATKSTVPVGTGREIARIIRERRPEASFDIVSNPEFLREGSAIDDFMRPDRVVVGVESERGAGGHAGALPAALPHRDAGAVHHARDGGADQVRRQLLPRDQDQLHQRDRGSVREGRRRRSGRRQGDRPRRPHRALLPARGPRLRRLLLPQGHSGLHPHRRGSGAAPARSWKRCNAATTPARSGWWTRSPKPAAAASRARPSRYSASPSSPTPTTCARARAS